MEYKRKVYELYLEKGNKIMAEFKERNPSEKLSYEEVQEQLKGLPGWKYEGGSIKKTYQTKHFPGTIGFIAALGAFCQKANHHPDYATMKYKEVEVSFSTHSAGGITMNDINIAKEIEKI